MRSAMTEHLLTIISARETLFFSTVEQRLRQWILVVISNRMPEAVVATATIDAGGETVRTLLELQPGIREYRCYAPLLWPDRPPEPHAVLRIMAQGQVVEREVAVGGHRPWTVYLLADVCTDYTWVYDDEWPMKQDDAAVTMAEIVVAEQTADAPDPLRNRYNLVHHREVEYFLEIYPGQAGRLVEHIRRGTITLNPFFTMCATCALTTEELIRHFYPAHNFARRHGLHLQYANHQETPAIAWATATILAGSGIRHLVKSILPYECPWVARLEEPPIFVWEGPDGSRILVRRRSEDYIEGSFVLQDVRATNTALHERILPAYIGLGDRYPYNAVALVGCYGDLAPRSRELAAKKTATISAYNRQGWEFPRLVNASHGQFWQDIDAQIAARAIEVPVSRGDYGAAWDIWPACLAHDLAGWRRAQTRAGVADTLMVILSHLDPDWSAARRALLADGWRNLIALSDHAWNGANDANRVFNAQLRRSWQQRANQAFDTVIDEGMAALGSRVATGAASGLLVFNSLGWERDGLVRIDDLPEGTILFDTVSNTALRTQNTIEEGQTVTYAAVNGIPSAGYRVLEIRPGDTAPTEHPTWTLDGYRFTGPRYRLDISPTTGGITSLYDLHRRRELVRRDGPYHLNQCLFLSDGIEYTSLHAEASLVAAGPLFATLAIRTALKSITLISFITLFAASDVIDIRNEVEKLPGEERQELDFAFPFNLPDCRYRFEAPGAIVTAGDEQLPGAGQAVTVVRHFVDVANDTGGVTLSLVDSNGVMFGRRTSHEDPTKPDTAASTVLALGFENIIDWHECLRDQAGVTRFTFRFRLTPHDGFDPVAAVRSGWECNNALLSIRLRPNQCGHLPHDDHSFLAIQPAHVVLTSLKVAEEEGVIARLWECAGEPVEASLTTGLGAIRAARATDLMERDQAALPVSDRVVQVPVRGRGLATVRIIV